MEATAPSSPRVVRFGCGAGPGATVTRCPPFASWMRSQSSRSWPRAAPDGRFGRSGRRLAFPEADRSRPGAGEDVPLNKNLDLKERRFRAFWKPFSWRTPMAVPSGLSSRCRLIAVLLGRSGVPSFSELWGLVCLWCVRRGLESERETAASTAEAQSAASLCSDQVIDSTTSEALGTRRLSNRERLGQPSGQAWVG